MSCGTAEVAAIFTFACQGGDSGRARLRPQPGEPRVTVSLAPAWLPAYGVADRGGHATIMITERMNGVGQPARNHERGMRRFLALESEDARAERSETPDSAQAFDRCAAP